MHALLLLLFSLLLLLLFLLLVLLLFVLLSFILITIIFFFFLFILFPLLCVLNARLHICLYASMYSVHGRTLPPLIIDNKLSSLTQCNYLLVGLPLFILPCILPFPSPCSAPLFSSHAHTTSTSFPDISLRFPPIPLTPPLFFHFKTLFRLPTYQVLHPHTRTL